MGVAMAIEKTPENERLYKVERPEPWPDPPLLGAGNHPTPAMPRCPHGVYDPHGDGAACTVCQNQVPAVGPFCRHGTTDPFCRSCHKTCVTPEGRALDEILRRGEKLDDAEIAEIATVAETTQTIVRQVLEELLNGQYG